MISYFVLTIYALQPQRRLSLPQISVLMQATTILTLTDQWISTRSVDRDMEEDVQNLATLMKHLPSCMYAADIEQLLQDIPEQPLVVVPARTVQEAVDAGDLPPLDVDAANVFTQSEHILQPEDHIRKHGNNSAEVKDLIQRVLHHPDFNTARSQGEQVEGGRDEEASQLGRYSGGC